MSEIIVVTNRNLCKENFAQRIEKVCLAKPKAIILREKDMTEDEYKSLSKSVMKICEKYGVTCILHSFVEVAIENGCRCIHLPMSVLKAVSDEKKKHFDIIGASCHSAQEAMEAQSLGCSYITAGHIFETDCKKGLEGRGLGFLNDVCKSVNIPVYAIGGIEAEKMQAIALSGAKGACIMSAAMTKENIAEYLNEFKVKNEV